MGKKDVVWNNYISQNERFADFFNGVIFQGKMVVCPEDLTALDSKLWRSERKKDCYHGYMRDNTKVWRYKGIDYILDLEPEDSPHFSLPVKYMNYESLEYDRQCRDIRKKHRKKRDLCSSEYLSGFSQKDGLMPVITIGVYLGKKRWTGCMTLSSMAGMEKIPMEIRDDLLPYCNDLRVNLWDIHKMKTSAVFRTDLREVFGFLKRQDDTEALKRYVAEHKDFRHLPEDAYDVVSVYGRSRELEIRKEDYRTEEGFDMCLAIRGMIEEGRKEGWQDGITAMNELIHCLINDGRMEDLFRSSQDMTFQRELMGQYGIQSK